MRSSIMLALSYCVWAEPALAQENDAQLWTNVGVTVPFSGAVALQFETNQRVSNDEGGLYESQYLVAVAIELAEGVTLTGGVNRVVSLDGGRVTSTGWRPRQ